MFLTEFLLSPGATPLSDRSMRCRVPHRPYPTPTV